MLGRIEGKLDSTLKKTEAHDEDIEKLTHRVSILERWRAYLLGSTAFIAILVPYIKEYLLR